MRWVAVVCVLGTLAACASGVAGRREPAATSASTSTVTPRVVAAVPAPVVPAAVAPSSATATPSAPNPCAHNTAAKLVKVSIRKQRMWLCAHTAVAYASPITSGMLGQYTETPTGRFTIQGVHRNTALTLIDGSSFTVKYWIPFDAPLFGFHDSSWQDFPYGSAKYKTDGSHGCVHLPLPAIRHLARWATVGTPVTIR